MRKSSQYFYFAFLMITLAFTSSAFADVKIKSRQTAAGQSYENTTYIKGKRQRTESMGGRMITLTQCDLRRSVQLNPQAKTYLVSLFEQNQSEIQNPKSKIENDGVVRAGGTITSTVTYKDTGEIKKMFGYTARHIITTMETVSSPDSCNPMNSKMQIDGWYIDAAFALDCDWGKYASGYTPSAKNGCRDKYQTKTIGNGKRGYPVYEKMTMFDESGKESFSTITEVLEISNAALEAALFDVPADYREAKDGSELYAASNTDYNNSTTKIQKSGNDVPTTPATAVEITNAAQANTGIPTTVGPKKAGVVRIGLTNVKTGAVGEGINAAELAGAIQYTLADYLKGTNIEIVQIEAKLASAIDSEAKQKECDYVIYAQASHKKGGGGFGGFGKIAPVLGNVVPLAGMSGNVAGAVAGQVAANVIYTAAGVASNVKSKDEISIDAKLQTPGNPSPVLSKQVKAKAKSDGEDIISPLVEQIAQAIVDSVAK